MATVSFYRDWTLTEEQAEKLAEVLDKPLARTITEEQVKKFDNSLKRGDDLLNLLFSRCNS